MEQDNQIIAPYVFIAIEKMYFYGSSTLNVTDISTLVIFFVRIYQAKTSLLTFNVMCLLPIVGFTHFYKPGIHRGGGSFERYIAKTCGFLAYKLIQ